jgi:glutathione S-transferase
MYTLHIANKNYSSWSLRPWVLMKELSIPFREEISPFKEESSWTEFRRFSPTGLVPCLVDDEQKVWDSLGITEYLAERHNQIWPTESTARTWARCATAEMHSGFYVLREQCPMNCSIKVKLNKISKPLQKDISRLDELWNEGISKFSGPFLAGEKFTAVDAFYAPAAMRIRNYGIHMSKASLNYVNFILSIDSICTWEQDAIKEPWHEIGHEEECVKYGVLTEDLRKG